MQDRLEQLDLPPEVLRWLKPWLAIRTGGSLDVGAFSWLLHIWALADWRWPKILEMSSRYRIGGGMNSLVQAIFADSSAELRLESPAAQVIDDGDQVVIHTVGGNSYAAPVAVIATLANLWSHIDFPAGLSTAKTVSSATGMQTPISFTTLWALVQGPVDNVYVQRPNFTEHPIIHLRKDFERPDGVTQVIAFSVDPTLDTSDHTRIAQLFRETLPMRRDHRRHRPAPLSHVLKRGDILLFDNRGAHARPLGPPTALRRRGLLHRPQHGGARPSLLPTPGAAASSSPSSADRAPASWCTSTQLTGK